MMTLFATAHLFAELALRGPFPLVAVILIGLVAVAAVVAFYVKETTKLGAPTRVALGGVRVLIVLAVAFLLLRPVWVNDNKNRQRRSVAVLVDASLSMDSQDPRPGTPDQWRVAIAYDLVPPDKGIPSDLAASPFIMDTRYPDKPRRMEVARAALTSPRLKLLDRLRERVGPVDIATFGSRRTTREGADSEWLKTLVASEPQTALADAVAELVSRDANDLPAAVVIVTDGRENASKTSLDELARLCARVKVPLHVYGVGSSAFGQAQLRDVAVPDTLFVDDQVSVPVRYRVKGVTTGQVEIVLKYGDREVARKVIDPVREGDDLREILTFTPTKQDAEAKKAELSVTINVSGGVGAELLADEMIKPVKVVDRKLKVLVVDSLPRWDFKFLQRALLRDRRVDARFFLTEGDRQTMRAGKPWVPGFPIGRDDFRKDLFEYDLVIFGDIPGTFWTPEQQQVIKDYVAEGGGLIQIAGRHNAPAGWAKSLLADVFPVEFDAVRFPPDGVATTIPFRPRIVPAAARSAVLALEDDPDDNGKLWRSLPEIYWCYPVTKLRPAAEVFLVHPEKKLADGKPMPVLAGHYYGKGYVLFVGFDETWRWRFNEADKYFGRFWSQAVYVAGVPRTVGTKLTQLSLDVTDPVQGKIGQVYARLFTKDFKPVTADEIEARLVKTDADPNDKDAAVPVKLIAIRGSDNRPTGEYMATLPFNRTGRFSLKVDPNNGNPAALDYRVNLPPEHELAPGGMAEADMRKLAEATGGKFYREEDLAKLPDQIETQYVLRSSRNETPLLGVWSFCILLGLLTLEWIARKFNGLS